MKRKMLVDRKDVNCSFCKVKKTQFRIQGHPLGGRTVCYDCWLPIKAEEIEYEKRWGNREQSEAEWQLGL